MYKKNKNYFSVETAFQFIFGITVFIRILPISRLIFQIGLFSELFPLIAILILDWTISITIFASLFTRTKASRVVALIYVFLITLLVLFSQGSFGFSVTFLQLLVCILAIANVLVSYAKK